MRQILFTAKNDSYLEKNDMKDVGGGTIQLLADISVVKKGRTPYPFVL